MNKIGKYLAAEWFSERVHIRDSRMQDVQQLTEIFNACNYVEPWDPTFSIIDESVIKPLIEKSLSTDGENVGFRLQCFEMKGSGEMIGYFHLQHYSPRLPQPDTAFISMFVIHPEFQGKQFAREILEGVYQQLSDCGYVAIWLAVYLKNWSALRFWLQQGFNKIIEYDGDKQ